MNPAVGIDLGTTNTVVAVQTNEHGPRILQINQPVEARDQFEKRSDIKSAVFFESPNSAVVGNYAARRIEGICSIKSRMGTRWRVRNTQRGGPLMRRGRPMYLTPAYISAHILKLAFDSVLAEFPQWDRSAVITVPAAFNTDQRADTLSAARLAGFNAVELMDEPTAAFYMHFDQYRDGGEFEKAIKVLVFDFGGGTLDVSIIRVQPTADGVSVDAIGRSRFNDLGGDDIDLDIAVAMLALWENDAGIRVDELPEALRSRMYRTFIRTASSYKERVEELIAQGAEPDDFFLSETVTDGKDRVAVSFSKGLTRDQYDLIAGQYFDNKREANIYRPIEQALELASQIDPSFDEHQLEYVLYTGGASQMCGVKAALEARFAPKHCQPIGDAGAACLTVALGAAAYRYDQLNRNATVKMSRRTLEAILTRPTPTSEYLVLVPVTAQQSLDFAPVSHRFTLPTDAVRVRIPLFRGTGANDHQLSPIRDVLLDLPHLLRADTPYTLTYRVSADKTIVVKARFECEHAPVDVEGSAPLDNADDDPAGVTLYPINH